MATETQPQVDAAEVYSRLGRIEGEQAQMNLRFDDMNSRLGRIEAAQTRLLYWVHGLGGTTLVTMVAILVSILLGRQS
ncbi:MAG: hypothetical protein OXI16_10490 [Chloroflexota bacterium]|nr:hypothetical protein [Chloroflexota bacterium]